MAKNKIQTIVVWCEALVNVFKNARVVEEDGTLTVWSCDEDDDDGPLAVYAPGAWRFAIREDEE